MNKLLLIPFVVTALVAARPAQAQDLAKAFDDAINALKQSPRGTCDGIPYSDIRDECHRKANEVSKWCKATADYEGPQRCASTMDPKRVQAQIEKLKERRDGVLESKEELERRLSSLTDDAAKRAVEDSIKDAAQAIEDAAREQETLEKEVEDATTRINDRVEEWTYCRDYREQAIVVFEKALSRVKSESDTTVAQRVSELVALLEATIPGHRNKIQDVGNTIEACKGMLYEIGRLGHFPWPNAPGTPFSVENGFAVSAIKTLGGWEPGDGSKPSQMPYPSLGQAGERPLLQVEQREGTGPMAVRPGEQTIFPGWDAEVRIAQ